MDGREKKMRVRRKANQFPPALAILIASLKDNVIVFLDVPIALETLAAEMKLPSAR